MRGERKEEQQVLGIGERPSSRKDGERSPVSETKLGDGTLTTEYDMR